MTRPATIAVTSTAILALILRIAASAQTGGFETREVVEPPHFEDAIVRRDFQRCEPAGSVLLDERKDGKWVLRTKDWPTPLLNNIGNAPDLTYDPGLKGVYDIYLGSRATHFPVSVGLKMSDETQFTIITCPRETEEIHRDWEFCFRRAVQLVLTCINPHRIA